MSDRPEITKKLRELVEKSLTARHMYWAPEVDFRKNTDDYRRIDFVGFKPYCPRYVVDDMSVENGTFACYEVKSSLADFKSGNGLTFYGDENYLVCPLELAEQLNQEHLLPERLTAVLCPTKYWDRLYRKATTVTPHGFDKHIRRDRGANELLFAIMQSYDRPRLTSKN